MEIIINPVKADWSQLCRRNIPDDPQVQIAVDKIIADVEKNGDSALRRYAADFDHTDITDFEVTEAEINEAIAKVSPEVKEAIEIATANISKFHAAQHHTTVDVTTTPGVRCIQRSVPIQTVGLYIPGGRAPLFSTVLMLAIPAKLAGCQNVVLCTPQSHNFPIAPEILYAAHKCGIHHIYRIGGAQAIAAMALGTESIPRVDKIFGPGNRFVTKAKQTLSRVTAIDMPAGPSEVLVLADNTADAGYVAADMLSQAEHGPDSQAILVCNSVKFAEEVKSEVERQTTLLSRTSSVEQSLAHSRIIVLPDMEQMLDFTNEYAPEHLIISTDNAMAIALEIKNAGSIFVGNYSPESAGDYASGTNHTLPTGGWAKSYNGVNLDSFMRKITIQELTHDGLKALAPTITSLAMAEGLDAHAAAVAIRINKEMI